MAVKIISRIFAIPLPEVTNGTNRTILYHLVSTKAMEEMKFQLFVDLAVMNACVSKLIYAAASHDQGMYSVLFPKCWKREICLTQATTPPTLEYHL